MDQILEKKEQQRIKEQEKLGVQHYVVTDKKPMTVREKAIFHLRDAGVAESEIASMSNEEFKWYDEMIVKYKK